MNCDPGLVEAYHDEELSPKERLRVEEHLADCDVCRGELERTRKLDVLLRKESGSAAPDWERYRWNVRRKLRRRRGLSWMGVAALFLFGLTVWNVYEAIRPDREVPAGEMSVRSELILFSSSENEADREAILARFGGKGDPAIRELVDALEDRDVRVQIAATQVLSRLKDDRVRELLLEMAGRPAKNVEEAEEEWDLEDPAITSCLVRAMEIAERDSDPGDLFTMLGEQGGEDPEVLDALAEWVENLLSSDRAKRRRLAIRILRRLDLELPWWSLLPLLESPGLGKDVLDLFRSRTGKEYGADPDRWRRHFQEL